MTELKPVDRVRLDDSYNQPVSLTELTEQVEYLQQHLPQVVAMQITAGNVAEGNLSLCAPLQPNINDKLTAFGGSLASLATLTGWVMTAILAQRYPQECDIVVTHTETDFKRPVKDELITATVVIPDSQQRQAFGESMSTKGRAKLNITVEIKTDEGIALTLEGHYLARIK